MRGCSIWIGLLARRNSTRARLPCRAFGVRQGIDHPAANPHFCYEWAFGGETEPTALCVWHSSLEVLNDRIVYHGNMRGDALGLERATEDFRLPSEAKTRARGPYLRLAHTPGCGERRFLF